MQKRKKIILTEHNSFLCDSNMQSQNSGMNTIIGQWRWVVIKVSEECITTLKMEVIFSS